MRKIIITALMFSSVAFASDYVLNGAVVDSNVDLDRVSFFQTNVGARLDDVCENPWYELNKDIDRDGDFISKSGVELCYDPCDYAGANTTDDLVVGGVGNQDTLGRPKVYACE